MHRVQKVPVSRIFALLAYASADGCNPNVNASAVGANSVPVLNLQAMMVSPLRLSFDEHLLAFSHGR